MNHLNSISSIRELSIRKSTSRWGGAVRDDSLFQNFLKLFPAENVKVS